MINGSIQEKKGNLYAVLSIPTTGGRYKQKWVSMGMKSTVGKRKQKERLDEIRQEYSSIICLEATEILFCDCIKKWNEETKVDKSITTYDGYCHMINKYVYPYFLERKLTLDKIDTMDIDCYYQGKCYNFNDYICVDDMGEPIKPDYVSHRFKEIIKKNELRHITFHDLRHSTASYYLSKGYSLKDIQELLGHSSYAFTADTYAHVDTSTKQEMADAITRELKAL